jgi:hypothetical protein
MEKTGNNLSILGAGMALGGVAVVAGMHLLGGKQGRR